MLARSFMTHVELGISQEEFNALYEVMGMLERGELKDHPLKDSERFLSANKGDEFSGHFNMTVYNTKIKTGLFKQHCGTAACIAGTCDLVFKTDFEGKIDSAEIPEELFKLFHMEKDMSLSAASTKEAAIAIRNYLTTGKSRWKEIIPQE